MISFWIIGIKITLVYKSLSFEDLADKSKGILKCICTYVLKTSFPELGIMFFKTKFNCINYKPFLQLQLYKGFSHDSTVISNFSIFFFKFQHISVSSKKITTCIVSAGGLGVHLYFFCNYKMHISIFSYPVHRRLVLKLMRLLHTPNYYPLPLGTSQYSVQTQILEINQDLQICLMSTII